MQRPRGRSSLSIQGKIPQGLEPWEELDSKLPVASRFTQNKILNPESKVDFQWVVLAAV